MLSLQHLLHAQRHPMRVPGSSTKGTRDRRGELAQRRGATPQPGKRGSLASSVAESIAIAEAAAADRWVAADVAGR
jgi:hypothetical protein